MKRERRSKEWWAATVARWRRSNASASAFAESADVNEATLRWWATQLSRGSRAEHGLAVRPIEIAVPAAGVAVSASETIDIVVGHATLRVRVGTNVDYVAALVMAMQASR